jgi:hypothetical protein
MTWADRERGWMAVPDEILTALAGDGFEECKRMTTTSRRDLRPAGGVWQGVNRTTGSVASAIWVARAIQRRALVFVDIDGERVDMGHHDIRRSDAESDRDEGGES